MTEAPEALTTGEHERHLALSTLVQQGTYVWNTVVMLAVITALARTLSLSAFGVYGLIVSFAAYLLVAQGAVEAAAIRAIAQATTRESRDRAFSMAFFTYLRLGLFIGAVIAIVGNLALGAFNIPEHLHGQARAGLIALGLITWFGWPLKTFQDLLRANQLFVAAAAGEAVAYLAFGIAMTVLLVTGAPLAALIGLGGSLPALTGLACAGAALRGPARARYRHGVWERMEMRGFLRASGLLFVTSLADLFIYSLDRVILGLFRPAATVGLYEGPVRAHNVIRQVQGVLMMTVLPAGARFIAEGDVVRTRELLVRGTRYTLFITLPIVVVFMTLAKPILQVWLGPEFGAAATAMTILVGYWLFSATTGVSGSMLIAAGQVRAMAIYAWSIALLNLGLSLALTPSMGINGVVLGTTIPYALALPFFLALVCRTLPVTLRDLMREAWLPAYSIAGAAAIVLLALRFSIAPDTLAEVAALAALGVGGSWLAVYALCLKPSERRLIADMAHVVRRRLRSFVPLGGGHAA